RVEEQCLRALEAERIVEAGAEQRPFLVHPGEAERRIRRAQAAVDGQAVSGDIFLEPSPQHFRLVTYRGSTDRLALLGTEGEPPWPDFLAQGERDVAEAQRAGIAAGLGRDQESRLRLPLELRDKAIGAFGKCEAKPQVGRKLGRDPRRQNPRGLGLLGAKTQRTELSPLIDREG